MSTEEFEYIEPTPEHVGQKVEVMRRGATVCRVRKLLSVLPSEIKCRFVCQDSADPRSVSLWEYARIRRPLTYAERQAKCGLKVGHKVKLLRTWGDKELGTIVTCPNKVQEYVGMVGVVYCINDHGLQIEFNDIWWWVPYFVLEKVVERTPTHSDIGAIVWINGTPHCTYKLVLSFIEEDNIWRGVVKQNNIHYVFPLSTLRMNG